MNSATMCGLYLRINPINREKNERKKIQSIISNIMQRKPLTNEHLAQVQERMQKYKLEEMVSNIQMDSSTFANIRCAYQIKTLYCICFHSLLNQFFRLVNETINKVTAFLKQFFTNEIPKKFVRISAHEGLENDITSCFNL